jgi:hypothetical protein
MSLKYNDLVGTIQPNISLDEFEPKSGETVDIIVVAFYLTDQDPANDLNTFIQRGIIDTESVEVSPNTDEEGRYLVFVEMERNDAFANKFQALVKDVENVAGKLDWKVKPYLSEITYKFNDPELFNFIITDPEKYVPKEKFDMKNIVEGIDSFLKSTLVTHCDINENELTIRYNRDKVITEVVDVGDYDTVIGRNFLAESGFNLTPTFETNMLSKLLGNCEVLPIDNYMLLCNNNKVMLIKNIQIVY